MAVGFVHPASGESIRPASTSAEPPTGTVATETTLSVDTTLPGAAASRSSATESSVRATVGATDRHPAATAQPQSPTGQAQSPTAGAPTFSNGPINGAGFMTVLAELPSGRLVAGGDSQGFFISDDGGRNWRSRNVIGGGADAFGSRGVAAIIVANVAGPTASLPTLFAAVGKRDAAGAAILRSDDQGETWLVDQGGLGVWFDGGNLPGGGSTRSRATSRLFAIADRGPYTADRHLMVGDMTGCVWSRSLRAGSAWSRFGCLPTASLSPIRSVAVGAAGDVIVATSRMGLAGSRGGGTLPQPQFAGVWRFAKSPTCTAVPCTYTAPTAPITLFGSLSQSVEELRVTSDDHLYAAVVDDRIVGLPTRLGGLWAGRPDGTAMRSVSVVGTGQLRNVVSVDVVSSSATSDTMITGASLPKAATEPDRTDFEVTRVHVGWSAGVPSVQALEPLAQDDQVDLTILGHQGVRWFVDGTSMIGNDQYVVSSVVVLRDGRYIVAGKAGLWVYQPHLLPPAVLPWQPAVYGIGATFLGDVALDHGVVYATDADRFLFRADLAVPDPPVRDELDQAPTLSDEITKGLSVTVLPDGTALVGEATSTFGGVVLAVPPGSGPSTQLPLPVNRQPVALESVGDTVLVGIADSGLWAAHWPTGASPPALTDWRRLTAPGLPPAAVANPTAVVPAEPTTPSSEATTTSTEATTTSTEPTTSSEATTTSSTDATTTPTEATTPSTEATTTSSTEATTTSSTEATTTSSTEATTTSTTEATTTSTSPTTSTTTTLPPPPPPPTTPQPFETVALPDDVSPASATVRVITRGGREFLVVETVSEGLWIAPFDPAATPLAWTQVAGPAALPGGPAQKLAYVPQADALFLTGIGTLSRIEDPTRCVLQACPLTAVPVPVDPAGWTPLSTSYGTVPIASDGHVLFVVAGTDITIGKPGTVFRLDPSAPADVAWGRLDDPDAVAANQMVRPIAVAAEGERLAVTTSGNGLVVFG